MDKYSKKLIELLKDHIDPMVKADRNLPSYSVALTSDPEYIGELIHSFGINPFHDEWSVYYQDEDHGGRYEHAYCPDVRTACAWFIRFSDYYYHLAEYLPFFEDKNDPEFVEAMKKVERTSRYNLKDYKVYTDNL